MLDSSAFFSEDFQVANAAEAILRSWNTVRIFHGQLPDGVHDSVRRMVRRTAISASETGHAVTYKMSAESIELSVGPPASAAITNELLQSMKPYMTESWKVFSS